MSTAPLPIIDFRIGGMFTVEEVLYKKHILPGSTIKVYSSQLLSAATAAPTPFQEVVGIMTRRGRTGKYRVDMVKLFVSQLDMTAEELAAISKLGPYDGTEICLLKRIKNPSINLLECPQTDFISHISALVCGLRDYDARTKRPFWPQNEKRIENQMFKFPERFNGDPEYYINWVSNEATRIRMIKSLVNMSTLLAKIMRDDRKNCLQNVLKGLQKLSTGDKGLPAGMKEKAKETLELYKKDARACLI